MPGNVVQINGMIEYYVGDSKMDGLLSYLKDNGCCILNCRNCGADIFPQAKNRWENDPLGEFHVICGACDSDNLCNAATIE